MEEISNLLVSTAGSLVSNTKESAIWMATALDLPIQIWQCKEDWAYLGEWKADESPNWQLEKNLQFISQSDSTNATNNECVAKVLDEHYKHSAEPKPIAMDEQRVSIVVSIPCMEEDSLLVGVVVADADDAELFCHLLEMAKDRAIIQGEHAQLSNDFDVFAAQMSECFEELAFFRNISECLEDTELSSDIEKMSYDVIPLLKTSIKAQDVVLFLVPDEVKANVAVDTAFVCDGESSIAEATCREILVAYRSDDPKTPVIYNKSMVAADAKEIEGIETFIISPIVKSGHLFGWILAINRSYSVGFEESDFTSHLDTHEYGTVEANLVSSAASMLASQGHNSSLFRQREQLIISIVKSLVSAIEAKDPYTCGHSERVAFYAKRLAEKVNYSAKALERIYLSGLLHDVGKIGISDAILCKPGSLTNAEYEEIKCHPDLGWDILSDLKQLNYILPGVVHHHERVDGKGYPDNLVGEEIPIDGRVMAVADAYDAMTSDRSYRKGLTPEKAISILESGAGTQWDAEFVRAFVEIAEEIQDIQSNYKRVEQVERQSPMLHSPAEEQE